MAVIQPLRLVYKNQRELKEVLVSQLLNRVNSADCFLLWSHYLLRLIFARLA